MRGVSQIHIILDYRTADLVVQDVEIHHLEMAHPIEFTNMTVVSHGPLRSAVKADIKYGQSTISITVSPHFECTLTSTDDLLNRLA